MNVAGRMSLKPDASQVALFNSWLDQKLKDSAIEASLGADLKLCLNEILSNLISYGLKDVADPITVVEIDLRPGSARASVTDNGTYFDIRACTAPAGRDLLNGDVGGFGIPLIKERASRIDYSRSDGLNRIDIACEAPSP